jgi:hypothetical protein
MIPHVLKREHRAPYAPGTKVWYAHYFHNRQGKRTGEWAHHVFHDGTPLCGVVEVFSETSQHRFEQRSRADIGELVIRLLDKQGNPTAEYERIHHIPPMHEMVKADGQPLHIMAEPEPQRWFAMGEDPHTSTAQMMIVPISPAYLT